MNSYRHLIIALVALSVATALVLLALRVRADYRSLDPDLRKATSCP